MEIRSTGFLPQPIPPAARWGVGNVVTILLNGQLVINADCSDKYGFKEGDFLSLLYAPNAKVVAFKVHHRRVFRYRVLQRRLVKASGLRASLKMIFCYYKLDLEEVQGRYEVEESLDSEVGKVYVLTKKMA